MTKKNQPTWRRYTFIALVVAGLALLFEVGVLLTRGLLITNIFTGTTLETLDRALAIGGGVVVLAFAVYLMLEPEKVRQVFTGRQAKYGSNAAIMTLAFLGILIVGNVLTYQNPKRLADTTEDKINTLAPETLQALKSLPEPVTAIAFYSALSTASAEDLLEKFRTNSAGMFSYQFVNPDTDPVAAREAGITGDGKIMLVMGERREIANFASETELTKALIKLINPEPRVVYFLSGHGEMSLDFSDNFNVATAKSTLESKNYTVNSLNLLAENKIPEDALAIVIAGPVKQVSQHEVQLLKEYVDGGGALVVMENPLLLTEFGNSPDPLADYLAQDWGITLNNDIIIDQSSPFGPLFATSAIAGQHPITQDINVNLIIIMPQARSLTLSTPAEGITQTPLLLTSENSWGEKNFKNAEGSQVSRDEEDLGGPLTIAVSGENAGTGGRVVVFGNSLFASSDNFDAYGNGNFFINSVDWAAEQEDLINITPNTPKTRTFIAPSQWQWYAILCGTVFILPGIAILSGVYTWWVRRRQG
ncbi:MAG: GldG family protein [Chloroflexi bacterium]|nr:GldG family protein [Chloroflexota bacterium]